MNFTERLKNISQHRITSNESLEWRFSEFKSLLSYCQKKVTEGNLDDLFLENAANLLKKVYTFGYELGSNKATEMIAGNYHKPLMESSLDLARLVFKNDPRMLVSFLNTIKWYEEDEGIKKLIDQEIAKVESQA